MISDKFTKGINEQEWEMMPYKRARERVNNLEYIGEIVYKAPNQIGTKVSDSIEVWRDNVNQHYFAIMGWEQHGFSRVGNNAELIRGVKHEDLLKCLTDRIERNDPDMLKNLSKRLARFSEILERSNYSSVKILGLSPNERTVTFVNERNDFLSKLSGQQKKACLDYLDKKEDAESGIQLYPKNYVERYPEDERERRYEEDKKAWTEDLNMKTREMEKAAKALAKVGIDRKEVDRLEIQIIDIKIPETSKNKRTSRATGMSF